MPLSHERLDVYQRALERASTSIPLNIAESNGKLSSRVEERKELLERIASMIMAMLRKLGMTL